MKMAREGRLRRLHRRDWRGFLNGVIRPDVWQSFLGRIDRVGDSRIRWTAKYIVICWLAIGWSVQGSLGDRFREGRELICHLFWRRRPGRSYQGLVKATGRHGEGIFGQFWSSLRETIAKRLGRLWRWHGWIVMAVDGSRVDAPRTRQNESGLGLSGRAKTHPQWWLTWIVHLPSKLIWDWRQGPGNSSERWHLQQMMGDLPSQTLLVGDIGFGGFDFLRQLADSGVSFLVRCASNTTLLVESTQQRIERVGQHWQVYLWPTSRRRKAPLHLRLIVLKRSGRRVYLLTNVMSSERLSRSMASQYYAARWGVEVGYRSLKQTLQRRKVLARTPEAGGMELAGGVLALALLMLQGAVAMGARVTELSVAAALKVLRQVIESLRFGRREGRFLGRLRCAVKDRYQRRRSKRARDWPHKKKEPLPEPPKLRRPTSNEKRRIQAFLNENAMALG
jgi:hypothetical protein